MKVTLNNKKIKLQNRERKAGNKILATGIKTNNGKRKFIGTNSNKPQLLITLPSGQKLTPELMKLINKYNKQTLIYVVSPEKTAKTKHIINSTDFLRLSKNLGLFINQEECVKSAFIIDKNRKVAYSEILPTLNGSLNLKLLEKTLQKTINKKSEAPKLPSQYHQDISLWYLVHG